MNIFDTIKSLSKGIAVLIDPDKFKTKVTKNGGIQKQFKIVKKLFNKL